MEQELYLEQPYLVFDLNGTLYGIEAKLVKEIFFLPELTPVAEARRDIVGLLNLRGEILPVLDLNLRFGYRRRQYRTSDSTIVLEWLTVRLGIIVDFVCDIYTLSPSLCALQISSGEEIGREIEGVPTVSRSIVGFAKLETDLVTILDGASLIDRIETSHINESEGKTDRGLSEFNSSQFCPDATPQEREIFQQRSQRLQQSAESLQEGERIPLAEIGLSGEYFAIDLRWVREFAKLDRVTPIPCCPKHIIGNTNLRGEIVTVVEIRSLLNLPIVEDRKVSQMVVVQVEDWIAGIIVDEVLNTLEIHPKTIVPTSPTGSANDLGYVSGTALYGNKPIVFLDLPKIFDRGELVVDEEVG
ncbi:MAG: chemotaxis protein CheW [Geitlerinemataceae cyanobacterium]